MWWTFAAALMGSSTALLIAFVAYPWQKRRDRQNELKREQREDYRRVVAEWHELDREIERIKKNSSEDPSVTVAEFSNLLRTADNIVNLAALSASPKVLERLIKMQNALYDEFSKLGRELVTSLSIGAPTADIPKVVAELLDEDKERRLKDFADLLSLMRSQDFGHADKLSLERRKPVFTEADSKHLL